MEDINKLTKQLEYIFLKKIIDALRSKKLSVQNAKVAANSYLVLGKFSSSEDAYVKIMGFVAKYPIFVELKNHMNSYQIKKNDMIKIEKMKEYIKQKNIDMAIKVGAN